MALSCVRALPSGGCTPRLNVKVCILSPSVLVIFTHEKCKEYKVKNIIIYGVNYSNYCDHGYCAYQKIDNVGSGEGYYVSNGYSIPITWNKSGKNDKTIYKIKSSGEELVVNDGNTYIQIYPTNGNLSIN